MRSVSRRDRSFRHTHARTSSIPHADKDMNKKEK